MILFLFLFRVVRNFVGLFLLTACLVPITLSARLNVVAATPDLASIAEMVGGDRVTATSLARGTEDPHFVTPRPSFIPILNRADLLLESGAELEVGWLPPLVQTARNRNIMPGRRGYFAASRYVELIGVPTGPIDRGMGDVHASGNPHFMLDPLNGRSVAVGIADRLIELDPEGEETYRENLEKFLSRLDRRMEVWTQKLAPFKGTQVVTYHKNYDYLARRFGFEIFGEIEPLPGIEPSPRQVVRLISSMREAEIEMIWMEPFRPRRTPNRVAEETGARLVLLPEQPGAVEGVDDYISLIDHNVERIVEAMRRD